MDGVHLGGSAVASESSESHDQPVGASGPLIERTHHVTALLVARQGGAWLPRTLAGLKAQRRPADLVVAVDAASTDDSGRLLREHLGRVLVLDRQALDDGPAHPAGAGFGRALAQAVAVAGAQTAVATSTDRPTAVRWYWILHDDSAPDPDALAELLAGADRNLNAGVLVPKTVAWADHGRLVGIGNRWAPGNPVVERLDARERDQGQYDVDRPVYTGDSAGMLVRADVWDEQGGFDPALGAWAAPTGLCRRVWGSGGSVMFIPKAVLAHRRAGHFGARDQPAQALLPRRRDREAMLLLELSRGSAWTLPLRYGRAWIATVVRSIALLVTHEPTQARAKLQGSWDVLGHPGRVHKARHSLRAASLPESTRPSLVRSSRGTVTHNVLDDLLAGPRARRNRPDGWRPSPRVLRPLLITLVLALLAIIRAPGVLFGAGTLRGGGLLPAPNSAEMLSRYLASWHDVGLGTAAPLPPYLALLATAGLPLLGSIDLVVRACFGLAVPLAFLSAYLSAGPTWLGSWRTIAALAWALLPAGVAAAGDGRISTLAVLLLGPPTARACVRALTTARAGVGVIRPVLVASALVGLVAAFAPTVYLLATVGCLIVWLAAGCPRWAVRAGLAPLLAGAGFLILWAPRLWTAPWLLLSDLGRTDPSLAVPAAHVLGLSPGGPGALAWPGIPLLVIAVAAAFWHVRHRGPLLAATGACVALGAVAWLPTLADRSWSAQVAARVWTGQPMLLISAVLLATLVALVNRPGRSSGLSGTGLVIAVAVLFVGWWIAPVQMATSQATGQPPVVTLSAAGPERPRAVVLTRAGDDRSGAEVAYAVSTTRPAELGDADALADVLDGQGLTSVIQGLVSGAGVDVVTELGGRAVRYVVFDGPPEDPLVAELDATSGLRRLASSADQSLWLVSGDPVRVELGPLPGASTDTGTPAEQPAADAAVPRVVVPVDGVPTSVDVILHPLIELPRLLVVAELDDAGWDVRLNGRSLPTQRNAQGMVTASITTPGELTVEHRTGWPWLATAHLLGMTVLLVVAIPWRRRAEPQGEAMG